AAGSTLVRQARALIAHEALVPWPELPGLNEVLGKFLHAALRRALTPREALERAVLQLRQPGALPSPPAEAAGAGARTGDSTPPGTTADPNSSPGSDDAGQPEPRPG